MSSNEEIQIIIDTEGNLVVSVTGTKGASCQKLTVDLEAALGNVTSDVKTPEYHERERTSVHNRSAR